jgi:hypothetical protein
LNLKTAKIVILPEQTQQTGHLDDVLKKLYDILEYDSPDCDIVLDFGLIDSFSTQALTLLPEFDALAQETGHRLILKAVPLHIRSLLTTMLSDSSLCFAA